MIPGIDPHIFETWLNYPGDIFQALGIGQVDSNGRVEVWPQGYLGLQRVYSYYVPTSYAPLLSHFHHVLFDDASWGFNGDVEDEDDEIHVHRTLNVVGSGAQHSTLFKDQGFHNFHPRAGWDGRSVTGKMPRCFRRSQVLE